MTVKRMDNVLICVEDLDAAIAFFVEIGLVLENTGPVAGEWVERVIGIDDVDQTVAMLRLPDGPGGVELAQFRTPAAVRSEPVDAPANTLGYRRVMFAVDDVDAVVARLLDHGAELVGTVEEFGGVYRLCYVRGPEGIVVGLAEELQEVTGATGDAG